MTNQMGAAPASIAAPAMTEAVIVQIDGNAISALSGRYENGVHYVDAIEHLEGDELVEVTKRLHHPVFMDTYFRYLSGKEVIGRVLKKYFENSLFQRPAFAMLSPEKITLGELRGPANEKSKRDRQARLIQQLLPLNPYDYPCSIHMQEVPSPMPHQSATRVTRVRLADMIPFGNAIAATAPSFHGAILGLHAAANVARLLADDNHESATTLCDVGKLRTLYTTALPDGRVLHNAIPVGLAGDHLNSARSYTPTIEYLLKLEKVLGVLLLSPDTSTSFPADTSKSGGPGSPQIDCTRFASQIARYHLRSVEPHLKNNSNHDHSTSTHYISGRASRVPGLRTFVEAVIGAPLRRIDRRPIPGIVLAPGIKWSDIADNILLLGGLLEVTRPDGFVLSTGETEFETISPSSQKTCSITALHENRLYVFEHKVEVLSL